MATVGKYHCVPDADTQKQIQAHRDRIAQRRAARASSGAVLGMLAEVQSQFDVASVMEPLDNPVINSNFGDL